jgi:enoyl-CoA hydratase/carnithine racemase
MSKLSGYADKYENIRFERRDGALLVRLHTGGGPFAFSDGAHENLSFAFHDIACDEENKVVVLTGTGDRFCTDFDYASFQAHRGDDTHAWGLRIRSHGRRLLAAMLDIEVPVISAINGPVVSHSELPLLADVALAADTTFFRDATHFVAGAAPGDGMHVVWTTLLGLNRGRYFLMTGQSIGAEEALRLGVVGEVLPPERLMDRAWDLALNWAAMPRATLIATRQVLTYEWKRLMLQQLHSGLVEEMAAISGAAASPPLGVVDLLKS